MGESSESPGSNECVTIGSAGCGVFIVLLIGTVYISIAKAKHTYSRRLFFCATAVSICELPRYILLIIDKAYTNKIAYVFHMVGSFFFFLTFTYACYLLNHTIALSKHNDALQPRQLLLFGSSSISERGMWANCKVCATYLQRMIFGRKSLIASNTLFAVLVCVTSVCCVMAKSLFDFFSASEVYKVFTMYDALANLIYAVALSVYGCRLQWKITQFSKQLHQSSMNSEYKTQYETQMLRRVRFAIRKLRGVMVACLISFTLRTAMLVIKLTAVEIAGQDTAGREFSWLPVYGIVWWILSDFIPRGLPIVMFIVAFSRDPREHQKRDEQLYREVSVDGLVNTSVGFSSEDDGDSEEWGVGGYGFADNTDGGGVNRHGLGYMPPRAAGGNTQKPAGHRYGDNGMEEHIDRVDAYTRKDTMSDDLFADEPNLHRGHRYIAVGADGSDAAAAAEAQEYDQTVVRNAASHVGGGDDANDLYEELLEQQQLQREKEQQRKKRERSSFFGGIFSSFRLPMSKGEKYDALRSGDDDTHIAKGGLLNTGLLSAGDYARSRNSSGGAGGGGGRDALGETAGDRGGGKLRADSSTSVSTRSASTASDAVTVSNSLHCGSGSASASLYMSEPAAIVSSAAVAGLASGGGGLDGFGSRSIKYPVSFQAEPRGIRQQIENDRQSRDLVLAHASGFSVIGARGGVGGGVTLPAVYNSGWSSRQSSISTSDAPSALRRDSEVSFLSEEAMSFERSHFDRQQQQHQEHQAHEQLQNPNYSQRNFLSTDAVRSRESTEKIPAVGNGKMKVERGVRAAEIVTTPRGGLACLDRAPSRQPHSSPWQTQLQQQQTEQHKGGYYYEDEDEYERDERRKGGEIYVDVNFLDN